jgi:tetrahydromethanopterin S-methyltransferase subunit G
MATDITTRFNISTRREDIFLEVMIYKVKADMEDDMSQIFTRLDDLETKVQALAQGKQQK